MSKSIWTIPGVRMFLFFADRHRHAWRPTLDLAKIDLGSGKRVLVKGGRLDLRRAFLVNLISHNRPMAEAHAPTRKPLTEQFKRGEPDWGLLDIPEAKHLPAFLWKQRNLEKMEPGKRLELTKALERTLLT